MRRDEKVRKYLMALIVILIAGLLIMIIKDRPPAMEKKDGPADDVGTYHEELRRDYREPMQFP